MIESDPNNRLTERENEIVHLLAAGWSNREIAEELSLTLRTIKFHTSNIYIKLHVKRRAEAILWALKQRNGTF